VFSAQGCGSCHTLAAAGSSGTVGPPLDDANLDKQRVRTVVSTGAKGMPAYKLNASDLEALGGFVATASRAK
jgi:mono/diheme cytochrome c family protein